MPKMHFLITTGPSNPTQVSLPFHIAVNGAAATGVEAGITLAGDAAVLIQQHIADGVVGIGVPPLKELLAAAVQKGVKLYV